ncbi:MAG: lipopolysaccharide assembly protein LapB [Ottowia sp.]|nr:lipopolysaccharide assembly protein LapB [Ottowia sp.]
MELELTLMLLAVPAIFALGWFASRLDLRQWRREERQAARPYYRGLNYLLGEQHDLAIDAFIEAVQQDPDTSELHFALGKLFRQRGEYERAVRVHEHLLARADLERSERERARFALAKDFLRAGLLDRAEAALAQLEGTPYQMQAWLQLLALHERAREWDKADAVAQHLQRAGEGDFSTRRAHYLCERAAATLVHGGVDAHQATRALLEQALQLAPGSARARIQLAGLLAARGDMGAAFDALAGLPAAAPHAVPLIASELVRIASACGQLPRARELLEASYAAAPSIDVADAIVQARIASGELPAAARAGYVQHMQQEPSLIAAARWLAHEPLEGEARTSVQRSLEHATRPLARYRCAACGFEAQGYFWQCPGCQAWESFPPKRIEEL